MSYKMRELKHCPFCGRVWMSVRSSSKNRFSVHCQCGTCGPEELSEEKAIRAWNIRDQHQLWNPFRFSVHFPKYKFSWGFRGNLASIDVTALLELLALKKKTGVIQLTRGEAKCVICMKDGKIVAASDNSGFMKLGRILCENGMISHENLENALSVAKASDKRLGEVLLSMSYIDQGTLGNVVNQQIQEALLELFFWDEGEFEYRDCTVKFDDQGFMGLDAMGMVMASSQEKMNEPAHG